MSPRTALNIARLIALAGCLTAGYGAASGQPHVTVAGLAVALSLVVGTMLGWASAINSKDKDQQP